MPRVVAIGWIAAGLLAALMPAAVRADAASDFNNQLAALKGQQQQQIRFCPVLDSKHPSLPASQLFSLGVERGMLVLRTPLPNSLMGQARRVKIGDQADWSLITLEGGMTQKGSPIIPAFFTVVRTSLGPQCIDILNLQQSAGTFMNFSFTELTPKGNRTIQLQQQFPNRQARFPGGCQLVLMQMTPGHPWTPKVWNSADFAALTLEHPAEAQLYLRPLLRQIDQEHVLTPDQMLAFQLFSDQWSTDPATAAKVTALVANLTGGDFRSRAHAQNQLAAMGKDAALVLIRLDRRKLAPEQNARIDRLIDPYQPMSENQAAKLRANAGFLANCLYSDDLTIRKSAFAQLLSVTKLPLSFDPAAAPATRSAQLAAILKQLAAAKPAAGKS